MRRAFTLIELMTVCMILVVVAGLVLPNVVAIKRGRDRDEVYASVLRLVQRARESAIQSGTTYHLTATGGNTLVLQRDKAPQEGDDPRQAQVGQQAETEDVDQVALSSDVSLGDLRVGEKDSNASDFTLHFYPDGRSEGGGLELLYSGAKRNLVVTTRGLASLSDGALPTASEPDWEAGDLVQRSGSATTTTP